MSAFTGDVVPKGYRTGQLQQFTPEQMQLFQQGIGMLGPSSFTSRLAAGDQGLFQQMEEPAHRQFAEKMGQLGSRFAGMGSFGGLGSSGFQLAGSAAASNFAQDLQAQRLGLQRQAIMDMQAMINQLLGQQPYKRFLSQKQRRGGFGGFLGSLLGGLGSSVAKPVFGSFGDKFGELAAQKTGGLIGL